jgi:hypothetical protein
VSIRQPRTPRRGRPLKFGRPARSITITLPEDVLSALRARNRDIARAIVNLSSTASSAPRPPAAVLHQVGRGSVIVVRPVAALRRLPGVDLVSLGDPDRALIAFTRGLTVSAFELRVRDMLDGPPLASDDAEVIAQLAALLREVRRTGRRLISEATIVMLEDAAGGPRTILPVRRRISHKTSA